MEECEIVFNEYLIVIQLTIKVAEMFLNALRKTENQKWPFKKIVNQEIGASLALSLHVAHVLSCC